MTKSATEKPSNCVLKAPSQMFDKVLSMSLKQVFFLEDAVQRSQLSLFGSGNLMGEITNMIIPFVPVLLLDFILGTN